jgi:hypothetical protein
MMSIAYPRPSLCLSFTLVLTTAVSAYSQTATFSGKVTDQSTGLGIANVAVVAQGNQTGTRVAVTDTQGNYTIPMGPNTNIKLRAYRTNFVFNPAQVIFLSSGSILTGPHQLDFSGTALPFPILIFAQAPILLTEDDSLKAFSVDSLFLKRDPFPLLNNDYFGNDKRTRIKLLLVDLDLYSGETLSIVTAQAIDQSQIPHNLVVEDLRKVPGVPWLSQLAVMLPSDLVVPGQLTVSVTVRGLTSNAATISVE